MSSPQSKYKEKSDQFSIGLWIYLLQRELHHHVVVFVTVNAVVSCSCLEYRDEICGSFKMLFFKYCSSATFNLHMNRNTSGLFLQTLNMNTLTHCRPYKHSHMPARSNTFNTFTKRSYIRTCEWQCVNTLIVRQGAPVNYLLQPDQNVQNFVNALYYICVDISYLTVNILLLLFISLNKKEQKKIQLLLPCCI